MVRFLSISLQVFVSLHTAHETRESSIFAHLNNWWRQNVYEAKYFFLVCARLTNIFVAGEKQAGKMNEHTVEIWSAKTDEKCEEKA